MSDSNFGGGKQFSQVYAGTPGPGNPTATVGSMPPQPWIRSVLDGRRMMYRRTPDSEFPSGYLGTIVDRRQDRMFDTLKSRINQRSYQRGVHLGERVDPGSYLWPEEQEPLRGIIREATTGARFAPSMEWFQPTPVVEGKMAPRGSESILTIDAHRASQLAILRPKYSLPARRQMSTQG